MTWLLAFLVVSNVFLWLALTMCMRAVSEWMDAMTDAYDEHQHAKDMGAGYATLSGLPLSSRERKPAGD